MVFFNVLLAALLLFSGFAHANDNKASLKDAEGLLDSGEYARAEDGLKAIIASDPKNPRAHQLLGDAYRKEGMLKEALTEYEAARKLGGENTDLLKSMGITGKWMKEYKASEGYYKMALALDPKDIEAKDDLESVRLKRGLTLRAMIGGWEPDYTKTAYEGMLGYSGIDKLDLYAGYGYADQVYYKRTKVYASGYYFYNPDSYLKLYLADKKYDYPVDPAVKKPNPDSNSYKDVPAVEIEISHWFTKRLRGTASYEFFRPDFFYDTNSTSDNHKISSELYYITPFEYLRLKVFYAVLRDPDPARTEIMGRPLPSNQAVNATATSVHYRVSSLLGGGVEVAKGRWSGELKYMPNRDLDNSYDYSIMTSLGYAFTENTAGRLDYVHDKYSSRSTYSGKTANVYMGSVFYKLNPAFDVGIGYKRIELPTKNEDTGFLNLAYKTGLVF